MLTRLPTAGMQPTDLDAATSSNKQIAGHSNATPIRFCFRQTTSQGSFQRSARTTIVNRSGIRSRVTTSRAAPVSEILRTVQSITPPRKMRLRGARR